MKMRIVFLSLVLLCFSVGNAGALDLGNNITIPDKVGEGTGWYSIAKEDEEVEPGNMTGQVWDVEGFFLKGTTLTMVGGFNFKDGQSGNGRVFRSGDIFIDTTGDAKYGPANTGSGGGNATTLNTFGYDYVLDMDYSNNQYTVYAINAATLLTVYYAQNDESNPWRYYSGGNPVSNGSFNFYSGLSNSDVAGLQGGSHYAVAVDLGFLGSNINHFTAHFTYECGNDNLMGAAVPEPTSMLLVGTGLVGLAGLGRRRRFNRAK